MKSRLERRELRAINARLLAGTALCTCGLLISAINAAKAVCVTISNVTTCTGADGTTGGEASGVSHPGYTLNVTTGAVIDTRTSSIYVSEDWAVGVNDGPVTIVNNGLITPGMGGVPANSTVSPPVALVVGGPSIIVQGDQYSPANDVSINNAGTIHGAASVNYAGGLARLTNSGILRTGWNDLTLRASGDVSLANTGVIGGSTVYLQSMNGVASLINAATGSLEISGSINLWGPVGGASFTNQGLAGQAIAYGLDAIDLIDLSSNLGASQTVSPANGVNPDSVYTSSGGAATFVNTGTLYVGRISLDAFGGVDFTNNGEVSRGSFNDGNSEVLIRSRGQNSFQNNESTFDPGGTFFSISNVGGDVTVSNAASGYLRANVSIDTAGDAAVDNAGDWVGPSGMPLFVISASNDVTIAHAVTTDPIVTATDGTTTSVTTSNSAFGFDIAGGSFTLTNAATGTFGLWNELSTGLPTIFAGVLGDISATNDGVISGGVRLATGGARSIGGWTETTTIVTPPSPSPAVTTMILEIVDRSIAHGGSVTLVNNHRIVDGGNPATIEVTAFGDSIIENNGVIEGPVTLNTQVSEYEDVSVLTDVNGELRRSSWSASSISSGGAATLSNLGASSLIAGHVDVRANGNVTVLNEGTIDERVYASGGAVTSLNTRVFLFDLVMTPEDEFRRLDTWSMYAPTSAVTGLLRNTGLINGDVELELATTGGGATLRNGVAPSSTVSTTLGASLPATIKGDAYVNSVTTSITHSRYEVRSSYNPYITQDYVLTDGFEYFGGVSTLENSGVIYDDAYVIGMPLAILTNRGGTIGGTIDVRAQFQDWTTVSNIDPSVVALPSPLISTTIGDTVGGDARLDNLGSGTIATGRLSSGSIDPSSRYIEVNGFRSATLLNEGTIGDGNLVRINIEAAGWSTVEVNTNYGSSSNPNAVRSTYSRTTAVTAGTANVTNSGRILAPLSVSGVNVNVNNSGLMAFGLEIRGVENASEGRTFTSSTDLSSETIFTPSDHPTPIVTSTLNTGAMIGGIEVFGANTVNAAHTVTLSGNSITLGGISAEEVTATGGPLPVGTHMTNTSVIVDGVGVLGGRAVAGSGPAGLRAVDPLDPAYTGGELGTGDVEGVRTLTKTGAGVFTIFADAIDADTVAINAGALEFADYSSTPNPLRPAYPASTVPFTGTVIEGDVVNNASLVARDALWIVGDFTQGAGGSTIIGSAPPVLEGTGTFGTASVRRSLGVTTAALDVTPLPPLGGAGGSAPSILRIEGDASLAGSLHVAVADGLYMSGPSYALLEVTGTIAGAFDVAPSRPSAFIDFMPSLTATPGGTQIDVSVRRASYVSAAGSANQAALASGLDSALPGVVANLASYAAGGNPFASVEQYERTRDLADAFLILDFGTANTAQAQAIFSQLDGQIYASLLSLDPVGLFLNTANARSERRRAKNDVGGKVRGWATVSYDGRKGENDAAQSIDGYSADALGAAAGFDIDLGETIVLGVEVAKGESSVEMDGRLESANIDSTAAGIYGGFAWKGLHATSEFAYGWSKTSVTRAQSMVNPVGRANYNSEETRFHGEIGYDLSLGDGKMTITPMAGITVRRVKQDGFAELLGSPAGAVGGLSLVVDEFKETFTAPELGVTATWAALSGETATLIPHAGLRYRFLNGDNDLLMRFAGGGDPFVIQGIDPNGYLLVNLGLTAKLSGNVSLYMDYNGAFGGEVSGHGASAGVRFGL